MGFIFTTFLSKIMQNNAECFPVAFQETSETFHLIHLQWKAFSYALDITFPKFQEFFHCSAHLRNGVKFFFKFKKGARVIS